MVLGIIGSVSESRNVIKAAPVWILKQNPLIIEEKRPKVFSAKTLKLESSTGFRSWNNFPLLKCSTILAIGPKEWEG